METTSNGVGLDQIRQPIPFTIRERTLVNRGARPDNPVTFHLEEVRDYLAKLEKLQDPEDPERSLDQLHVDFAEGHMHARFLAADGIEDLRMLVTDNGASQLAREVLPSRFFPGLRQLAGHHVLTTGRCDIEDGFRRSGSY